MAGQLKENWNGGKWNFNHDLHTPVYFHSNAFYFCSQITFSKLPMIHLQFIGSEDHACTTPCMTFLLQNADTCKLFMPAGFGRVNKRYVKYYLFTLIALWSVLVVRWRSLFQWSWWWGDGVPQVCLVFFKISVSYSQFHYMLLVSEECES